MANAMNHKALGRVLWIKQWTTGHWVVFYGYNNGPQSTGSCCMDTTMDHRALGRVLWIQQWTTEHWVVLYGYNNGPQSTGSCFMDTTMDHIALGCGFGPSACLSIQIHATDWSNLALPMYKRVATFGIVSFKNHRKTHHVTNVQCTPMYNYYTDE